MNDIKLALLGNKEAAKRLTEKGVLLPCPWCGKTLTEDDLYYRWGKYSFFHDCKKAGPMRVEERLPTDEHPVLVFVGYADTMTGFITTSSYFCFDENPHWQWDGLVRDEQRTLFWMPLPAPPDRRPPEGEEDA